MQATWIEAVGYLAASAGLYSTWSKTMIPLRVASIAANVLFIAYGGFKGIYPTILVNCVLLPLNFVRLRDMRQLIARVRHATEGDLNAEWLRPFVTRRRLQAGEPLWAIGDAASEAVYIFSGSVELVEIAKSVGAGALIGEMGLFDPGQKRMLSARCETDVEIGILTYDEFRLLYYQNPEFGFFLLRLVTQRLQENAQSLANPWSARTGPQAAPAPIPNAGRPVPGRPTPAKPTSDKPLAKGDPRQR